MLNIMDSVENDKGRFSTLLTAIKSSGLSSTLKSTGPFTIFAPTDEAFADLPTGTLDSLLKDLPKLANTLSYHIVAGRIMASKVVQSYGKKLSTKAGKDVNVSVDQSIMKINNAKVIIDDIICDNGVIHVIDRVLFPPTESDTLSFRPADCPGVSSPLNFFDPLGFSRDITEQQFKWYQESELKHGRLAMIAFLGIYFGETGNTLLPKAASIPAIFHYQLAEKYLNAFTFNIIGLILAIEGYNIITGWKSVQDTFGSRSGLAGLREDYTIGDLNFDPLDFRPTSKKAFKKIRTKELNNGRLAMIAVIGIIVQELVTGKQVF